MKLRWFELLHFDNVVFSLFFNVFSFLGLLLLGMYSGTACFLSISSSSFILCLLYFTCALANFILLVCLYFLFSFYENNIEYRAFNCACSPDLQSPDNKESITG